MDDRQLAIVELLGALTYGQLRAFEASARSIPRAPDAGQADAIAAFAVEEHARYVRLRAALEQRTELPGAVMDRQRAAFDAYFDNLPLEDWFGVAAFFALGLPIASDFARAVAPAVDDDTAELIVSALDRADAQKQAIERFAAMLEDDDDRERARHLAADLLGRALTGFQFVVADTDALAILLDADRQPDESPEGRVKRLAMGVLEGHRRRVIELGLEDLDDVS